MSKRNNKSFVAAFAAASVFVVSSGAALEARAADDDPPEKKKQEAPAQPDEQGPGFGQMQGQLERVQKELDLSGDQMEKLQGLGAELQGELMEGFQRFGEEGFPQGEDLQKQIQEFRTRIEGRLGEILTPDQQEKIRGMMGSFGEQFGENFGEQFRNGEGLERVRDLGRNARLEQIKAALMLSAEEEQVIVPLIVKVMDAQAASRRIATTGRSELTTFLRSGAEREAIEGRVTDFRKKVKEASTQLEAARGELRELLTLEQEAKLVAFGILE